MNLKELTEEFIVAMYDLPSPDNWRVFFVLSYEFPYESPFWERLRELDEKFYLSYQEKREQEYMKLYKKDTKQEPLDSKGKKTPIYINWRIQKAKEDEEKLMKEYEKEKGKSALTKKGEVKKRYISWKNKKFIGDEKHFWDFFKESKNDELWKSLSSKFKKILNEILYLDDRYDDDFILKINFYEIDSMEHFLHRYEYINHKSPFDNKGKLTNDFYEWVEKNREKGHYLKMLRDAGIKIRPKNPVYKDFWTSLTKEQALHNSLVKLFADTPQAIKVKHNNLVKNKKNGVAELYDEIPYLKGKRITNGLPSIIRLPSSSSMKGKKFVPDGRLLRLTWTLSQSLFTKEDKIYDPKYLEEILLFGKSSKSKMRNITNVFTSARSTFVKKLRDVGFIPIKDSEYLVDPKYCFAPNTKNPSSPSASTFNPKFAPNEYYWNDLYDFADYSWDSKIHTTKQINDKYEKEFPNKSRLNPSGKETNDFKKWKKKFLKNEQGGFRVINCHRLPSSPIAETFQEILVNTYLPCYTLLREFMTTYKEKELQEFYKYQTKKNALDSKNKETDEYKQWKVSFMLKHKGKFKGVFQYGYESKLKAQFEDWCVYLRVKSPSDIALIKNIITLRKSISLTDPNFLRDVESSLNEKYKDYIEKNKKQSPDTLKNWLNFRYKIYFGTLENYPFADPITDQNLDGYIDQYNKFITAYNKKTNKNEPLIKGTLTVKRRIAIQHLKSYGWYYSIPTTQFMLDDDAREDKEFKNRRKIIESKLFEIEEKLKRQLHIKKKVSKKKSLNYSHLKYFYDIGSENILIDYYEDIHINGTDYDTPDDYLGYIEELIPQLKQYTLSEIEEKFKKKISDKEVSETAEGLKDIEDVKPKLTQEDISKQEIIVKKPSELEIPKTW